jgi:hypothetical protein
MASILDARRKQGALRKGIKSAAAINVLKEAGSSGKPGGGGKAGAGGGGAGGDGGAGGAGGGDEAGGGEGEVMDPEEVNDTPVYALVIDPHLLSLRRLHLVLPPSWLLGSLIHCEALPARLQVLQALGAIAAAGHMDVPGAPLHLPDIPAILPHPAPLPKSLARGGTDVAAAQAADGSKGLAALGYITQPTDAAFSVRRLAALVCDLDPTSGAALRATAALAGGTGKQAATVVGGVGSKRPRAAMGTLRAAGLHFRVRCAAAAALAVQASARLPGYGKSLAALRHVGAEGASGATGAAAAAAGAKPGAPAAPQRLGRGAETYAGLCALLRLYQHLYFARPAGAGTAAAAAAALVAGPIGAEHTAAQAWGLAAGGAPLPVVAADLSHLQLRVALLQAISGVRHADGRTPDAAVLLLTRVLRAAMSATTETMASLMAGGGGLKVGDLANALAAAEPAAAAGSGVDVEPGAAVGDDAGAGEQALLLPPQPAAAGRAAIADANALVLLRLLPCFTAALVDYPGFQEMCARQRASAVSSPSSGAGGGGGWHAASEPAAAPDGGRAPVAGCSEAAVLLAEEGVRSLGYTLTLDLYHASASAGGSASEPSFVPGPATASFASPRAGSRAASARTAAADPAVSASTASGFEPCNARALQDLSTATLVSCVGAAMRAGWLADSGLTSIICNFLHPVHPVSRRATGACTRLAAFSTLLHLVGAMDPLRLHAAEPTAGNPAGPGGHTGSGAAADAWCGKLSSLLDVCMPALPASGAPSARVADPELRRAMLLSLYLMHHASDVETTTLRAGVPLPLRLLEELQGEMQDDLSLRALADAAAVGVAAPLLGAAGSAAAPQSGSASATGGSGADGSSAPAAPAGVSALARFAQTYDSTAPLLDSGLLDWAASSGSGGKHLALAERRLYGLRRMAPGSYGSLTTLLHLLSEAASSAAGAAAPAAAKLAAAAAAAQSIHGRLWALLTAALRGDLGSSSADFSGILLSVVASVFGRFPAGLGAGSAGASSSGSDE